MTILVFSHGLEIIKKSLGGLSLFYFWEDYAFQLFYCFHSKVIDWMRFCYYSFLPFSWLLKCIIKYVNKTDKTLFYVLFLCVAFSSSSQQLFWNCLSIIFDDNCISFFKLVYCQWCWRKWKQVWTKVKTTSTPFVFDRVCR